MRKNFLIMFAAVLMSVAAVAMAAEFDGGEYVEAEGIVYYEPGQSPNVLRRIAIMDAYRYLAEQVDTIYVSGNSTVKNMRELDEQINAKVDAALRGAKVISVTRENDGAVHAIVRMSIYGKVQSLASAVLGESIVIEDFPKPKFTNIHSEVSEVGYTGLIVDCRGLKITPAVTPAIKSSDGTEIYAYKNLGYQTASEKGIVEYSSNSDSARAGNLPLTVRAVKVSGGCDVVVSADDADKILLANQATHFLNNCAVVFLR